MKKWYDRQMAITGLLIELENTVDLFLILKSRGEVEEKKGNFIEFYKSIIG
jgi:hypothetical protein